MSLIITRRAFERLRIITNLPRKPFGKVNGLRPPVQPSVRAQCVGPNKRIVKPRGGVDILLFGKA
jgi:hypothetical protein